MGTFELEYLNWSAAVCLGKTGLGRMLQLIHSHSTVHSVPVRTMGVDDTGMYCMSVRRVLRGHAW
jgi:hypothetical protein